jgi:hypothetical protein
MRKDWKYILYLILAFGLFVAVKLLSPHQYDWTVTFAHDDKNPYGAYALSELLPDIFPENGVRHTYLTLYEIKDSLKRSGNILSISSNFSAGKEDTEALLKHVAAGGSAFISAHYFLGHFSDTLKLSTYDYFFKGGDILARNDTAVIQFVNPSLDTTKQFYFKRDNTHNYFNKFDTTRTTVIAMNDRGNPVTVRVAWGKGALILNCTPLAFTNIYLLSKENHKYASTTLSYLPKTDVEWTEYYHIGRMEAQTPLRFILTNEPLRWAYYLVVISILLFMLVEIKRKQRVIPIIKPLENTTLEFVSTIGNLYYQSGEHKNVAEKKIHFFLDQVRTKYWLSSHKLDEAFIQALTRKSGKPEEEVRGLITVIIFILNSRDIAVDRLVDLNERIEKFNQN